MTSVEHHNPDELDAPGRRHPRRLSLPRVLGSLTLVTLVLALVLVLGPRECSDAWLSAPGTDAYAPQGCTTPTDEVRNPPDLRAAIVTVGAVGAALLLLVGPRARLLVGLVTTVLLAALTALMV